MRFLASSLAFLSCVPIAAAAITPEQISKDLSSPPEVVWSTEAPPSDQWESANGNIRVDPAAAGDVYRLSATVTGPGVMEMVTASSEANITTILVDGQSSGPRLATGAGSSPNRVGIGSGTHTVTWRIERQASTNSSSTVVFRHFKWQPVPETSLQAAVSGSGVTLSGDWRGQGTWHPGGGAAAWSGVIPFTVGPEPEPGPELKADFQGPGILSFRSFAVASPGWIKMDQGDWRPLRWDTGKWARDYRRGGDGPHTAKWAVFPGTDSTRNTSEVMIGEVKLTPEIDIAHALGASGRVWTPVEINGNRSFGVEMDETPDGEGVVLDLGAIRTAVTGGELFRIRAREDFTVTCDGANLSPILIERDSFGWQSYSIKIPEGGQLLEVRDQYGYCHIDSIEQQIAPANPGVLLGIESTGYTTGGDVGWGVAEDVAVGRYVARAVLTYSAREAWLDLPVTGPARLSTAYKVPYPTGAELHLQVNGRACWDSTVQPGSVHEVTLEVPAGEHVIRFFARNRSFDPDGLMAVSLFDLKVSPISGDGLSVDPGSDATWVYTGKWQRADDLSPQGKKTIRPLEGRRFQPGQPRLRRLFSSPGNFGYRLGIPLAESDSWARWIVSDSVERTVDVPADGTGGWKEKREIWFPAGAHWIEWIPNPGAGDYSSLAIGDDSFTESQAIPLADAMGNGPLVWENDPHRPWIGTIREVGAPPVVSSPVLPPGATTRLATTVTGPGVIAFDVKKNGSGNSTLDFKVNGQSRAYLGNGSHDGQIHYFIDASGPVLLEWITQSGSPNWVELRGFFWRPWVESPFAEALDTSTEIDWETSAEHPVVGRPHPRAVGGTAAYIDLEPDEETWIETTVDGPGLFDFWLLGSPQGFAWNWQYHTYVLSIDGREIELPSHRWPAIFVSGDGPHQIRITVRASDWIGLKGSIDQVSWKPLVAGSREGWTSSSPLAMDSYTKGGRADDPVVLLHALEEGISWVEKTVTGPGLLKWDEAPGYGEVMYSPSRLRVTLDGVCELPEAIEGTADGWNKSRLAVPGGTHVIRWTIDHSQDAPVAISRANELHQISGMKFTPGVPALAGALDAPDELWLLVGEEPGSVLPGSASFDGEDAYRIGKKSWLYHCNPSGDVVAFQWRTLFDNEYEGPEWLARGRVGKPGECSLLMTSDVYGNAGAYRGLSMDSVSLIRFPGVSLDEALDTTGEIVGAGWNGIAPEGAGDAEDLAWSVIDSSLVSNSLVVTTSGAKKIRFRWRCAGQGELRLKLNGAVLPVPSSSGAWATIQFEVRGGTNVLEWEHHSLDLYSDVVRGEAWVDALEVTPLVEQTLDQVIAGGMALGLASVGNHTDQSAWLPLAGGDEDHPSTGAARAANGRSILRAQIQGPARLSFRARCFGPQLPEPLPGWQPPGGGSSVVIIGSPGETYVEDGQEVTFRVNGVVHAGSVRAANDSRAWQEFTVDLPSGNHVIGWQLSSRTRGLTSGAIVRRETVPRGVQGWVDGIRIKSSRDFYNEWAAGIGFAVDRGEPDDDADDDGSTNLMEFALGTDPLDAAKKPEKPFGIVNPNQQYNDYQMGSGGTFILVSKTGPVHHYHVPYVSKWVKGSIESSADLLTWQEHDELIRSSGPEPGLILLNGERCYYLPTHQVLPKIVRSGQPVFFRMKVGLPPAP